MSAKASARAEVWVEYLTWNDAVADVIYPPTDDGQPAYMDMEPAELRAIAEHAGHTGEDPRGALAAVVRAATGGANGIFSLDVLDIRTKVWSSSKEKRLGPPPCLAFLAVTVLAAEDMGKADAEIASNAYYAHLAKLLGRAQNDHRVRQQYRRYAEFLWRSVNRWLEDLDGERGIPTAYALTHRYIGLPVSQALVREGDRRKFPAMFAQCGLSPGMQIAPEDLIGYLDHWMSGEGSPASSYLRRLWRRQAARERIATVAAVELASWDGVLADGSATSVAGNSLATRAMVVANLSTGFLNDDSLDISLGLRPLSEKMDGRMQVRSTDGSWLDIGFSPGTAGLWRTSYTEAIDFGSMLEGVVRIRHAGTESDVEYTHFPRTVIPLVYNELQSAFIETERLELGVDSLLLVRSVAQTKVKTNVVAEVQSLLEESARPGFQRVDDLAGLPSGWVLFKDVQLFRAPNTQGRNELVPLARDQLTIAGGLRIPSRIRKWSSLSPPEVRAAVQSDLSLCVTLTDTATDVTICTWRSDTGVLVAPLAESHLDDGDYQVSLFTGDDQRDPIQQASIRLRSSEDVDGAWERAPRLVYELADPRGVMSASEAGGDDEWFVDGMTAAGDRAVEPSVRATGKVIWSDRRPPVKRATIQIGAPDPSSCIVTGAHRMDFPTYFGPQKGVKFIDGECRSCGLVKRLPSWPTKKRQKTDLDETVDLHDLEPIEPRTGPDWDAALDALMHLGGGPISSLESIALQLEGSSLFVDNFIRSLEALGHIAIERDALWRAVRWEISPSCLAETTGGSYRFTGFWPSAFVEGVVERAGKYDARVSVDKEAGGPSTCAVSDLGNAANAIVVDSDISIVVQSGARMLEVLPRLSAVGEALPRTPMPGFQSAERFDVWSASWVITGDPFAPGAYRLRRGFETTYLFRAAADVVAKTAAIAPVHLVKHLAANDIGTTLVSYHKKIETVLLPQGSDLPGLYGRAVVAMSGRLPATKKLSLRDKPARRCLAYTDVDRDSADLLVTLLAT
ncbi:hypothetical protein C5E51_26230 [Nocardia nova]|uniref:hypothetical protein n=1 Tax=Nocardia nova TaxID=37330 RepID=UPI000CEA3403|nr:hypothetical protein [Nocardia nova]PPJ04101.1 hypothetical protein C5E51_26230 [Nocardia nova]